MRVFCYYKSKGTDGSIFSSANSYDSKEYPGCMDMILESILHYDNKKEELVLEFDGFRLDIDHLKRLLK